MSGDITKNMPDRPSFEELVLARFDAIDGRLNAIDGRLNAIDGRLNAMDGRLDSIDGRLQAVEIQSERRASETRPIWERALAEILELRQGQVEVRAELKEGLANIERKLNVLSRDIVQVRADQVRLEDRLDKLEPNPTQ